ncbi:hypothetical protein [Brachybacterium sp. AOP29-B2-41]|uniref:hypothetical protein n=1 Tax=Brachybacterium sp. AOP29-B2-41 TaxID=3457704 RepID=UPI004034F430
MTATMVQGDAGGITSEVHTEDSLAYARTIQSGLTARERRALAAIYENMPCSVSAVGRIAGGSRRTAQRACDALESEAVALVQRIEAGLIIHPDAIGAVDAWAYRHGRQTDSMEWWKDSDPAPDGKRLPQDGDSEPWPDDVFPEPGFDPAPSGEGVELALRAVESRISPMGRGTFIPFAVLDYANSTTSLTAAQAALECGRRANRYGVAEFERGELARVTGMSPGSVTNALARMRGDGIAATATTTRVELDLRYR